MKPNLNMDKIATGRGAERRGEVRATGGHFGALQLVADVRARFKPPASGGRGTDPAWTERRLLPLAKGTLDRLQQLSNQLRKEGVAATPLQVAALLLERAMIDVEPEDVAKLARDRAR